MFSFFLYRGYGGHGETKCFEFTGNDPLDLREDSTTVVKQLDEGLT